MRLLIAEDNPAVTLALSVWLPKIGHEALIAADGEQALRLLDTGSPDLLVLDLGLPRVPGIEVLKIVRRRSRYMPVLLFTARDRPVERLAAEGLAADAVLGKPFGLKEFEDRLTDLQLRFNIEGSVIVACGPLRCSPRDAWIGERVLALSAGQRAVAFRLVRNEGRPVADDQSAAALAAAGEPAATADLERCIAVLREQLVPHGLRITRLRGLGHCLTAG